MMTTCDAQLLRLRPFLLTLSFRLTRFFGEKPGCSSLVAMAMDFTKRWSLRDFGSLQFLWDGLSGEYIQVYGSGAVVDIGPWSLDVSGGSARLVQVIDEGDPALLKPEDLASVRVRSSPHGEAFVVDERDAGDHKSLPLRAWRQNCACKQTSVALKLPVDGHAAFEGVFHWEAAPRFCGDKPVCLWVDFKWLIDYVYGKNSVDSTWSLAKSLKSYVERLGLDESHVEESARSSFHWKKKSSSAETDKKSNEWRVSSLAAFLFLENAVFDKRWSKAENRNADTAQAKAKALLKSMMFWPRRGETSVAFVLDTSKCNLLLRGSKLDVETLQESEESKGKGAPKIGALLSGHEGEAEVDLFELLQFRRSKLRYRSRLSNGEPRQLDDFLLEVVQCLSDLLETTRDMGEWSQRELIDLGVLTTPSGRCRDIPSSYKSAVIGVVRENAGLAGSTISAVVGGAARSQRIAKKGRVFKKICRGRKGALARASAKHAVRTAKSQATRAQPEVTNFEQKVKPWERKSYYRRCQHIAAKQRRLSLAMDATDVSYKKTMNATMCLPQLDLHMWLPPQDLCGTRGVPSMWPPRPCLDISVPRFPHFFLPFLLVWSSLSWSIHHKPRARAHAQALGSGFWFCKPSPSPWRRAQAPGAEPRPLAQGLGPWPWRSAHATGAGLLAPGAVPRRLAQAPGPGPGGPGLGPWWPWPWRRALEKGPTHLGKCAKGPFTYVNVQRAGCGEGRSGPWGRPFGALGEAVRGPGEGRSGPAFPAHLP